MSATERRRRERIESRERVTFERGEGAERIAEARERVQGQRRRQARELRERVAERARGEGLDVSEEDVEVREEDGEIRAELREEAVERETERAESEARESAREQALEAAEEQGLDVSEEDIEVEQRNGEFVAQVDAGQRQADEADMTAETPTGRAVESLLDPVTEPIQRGTQALAGAITGLPEDTGPAPRVEATTESLTGVGVTPLRTRRSPVAEEVTAGGVEAVGEVAALPELGIRVAEDAQAISAPGLRAGTPTRVGGGALPSPEASETAVREAEAVPGQVASVASQTAEFAAERPARFAGQLAGGALLSAGATGAAARAGVIPESVQSLPTTGEVVGRAGARAQRFTTEAGRRAVERAAPVLRRELEATPIDADALSPLTTRRETVGAVFRQPEGGTTIRELRRAGVDAPESETVDPDITVEAGEPGPFGRVREEQVQRTLTGEEIPAQRTRGFIEETQTFEGEGAGLAERADVGGRAQVGEADFGGGEQVVVEAARGQTALPEVAIDVVEPGLARRFLGESPRLERRGAASTEAMEAATGEVLGGARETFERLRASREGERAELTLLGDEGGGLTRETFTPEEAAREAIEQTEPRFIDPETPTERGGVRVDDGGRGFAFDLAPLALGTSPAGGVGGAGVAATEGVSTFDGLGVAEDVDMGVGLEEAAFAGPATEVTDVVDVRDRARAVAVPDTLAGAFGGAAGTPEGTDFGVPVTPDGFVPEEEEPQAEEELDPIFGEERETFELPTVGDLV